MKKKAYLGIDIGSISTKGVIINENHEFLGRVLSVDRRKSYRSYKEGFDRASEKF